MKRAVELLGVKSGTVDIIRWMQRERDLVLAYHNVVPAGEDIGGDRSLHLPRRHFARQLDRLVDTHEVVPLADIVSRKGANRNRQPRAAITFDDGYRGALSVGVEELSQRGLPATFFISPGLLGQDGFWWDELADSEHEGPPSEFRRLALVQDCGRSSDIYCRAHSLGISRSPQPEHCRVADEHLLTKALQASGIQLGSHTWSHSSLDRIGTEELVYELRHSLDWLQKRFGERVDPFLSLPYGRTRPTIEEAARAAGYHGVLSMSNKLVRPDGRPMGVPRINIPAGISLEGFVLRTVGL